MRAGMVAVSTDSRSDKVKEIVLEPGRTALLDMMLSSKIQ